MKPYVNPFDALLAGDDPVAAADAANLIAPPTVTGPIDWRKVAPEYWKLKDAEAELETKIDYLGAAA
jgi:hypothetical protein